MYGIAFLVNGILLPYFEILTTLSEIEGGLHFPVLFYIIEVPFKGIGRKEYLVSAVNAETNLPLPEDRMCLVSEIILDNLQQKFRYEENLLSYEFKPYEEHWEKKEVHHYES